MLFQIHPIFPSKQTHPYTTNHLWTTECFPILRPQIAQLFQTNQSSISVQQKVLAVILEHAVSKADLQVYDLTTVSFHHL